MPWLDTRSWSRRDERSTLCVWLRRPQVPLWRYPRSRSLMLVCCATYEMNRLARECGHTCSCGASSHSCKRPAHRTPLPMSRKARRRGLEEAVFPGNPPSTSYWHGDTRSIPSRHTDPNLVTTPSSRQPARGAPYPATTAQLPDPLA